MTEKEIKIHAIILPSTPEAIEKANALQTELRQKYFSPYQFMTAEEKERIRARIMVREQLESIQVWSTPEAKKQYGELHAKATLIGLHRKIAENFYILGDFIQAEFFAVDEARKQHFAAMIEAEELPDNEWCQHPLYKLSEEGKTLNNYFRERNIFSKKKAREVAILRCNECGFRNIKDLPPDLALLSQKRAEAVKAVEGLNSEAASRKLTELGLTSDQIFGT
jgi:hypothetical protein